MNRARIPVAAVVATLAVLSVSACSGGGSSDSGGSSKPTKGGTLNILTQSTQIDHLDPQRDYVGEDFAFESAYLVRTLTAYTLSSDGKTSTKLVGGRPGRSTFAAGRNGRTGRMSRAQTSSTASPGRSHSR